MAAPMSTPIGPPMDPMAAPAAPALSAPTPTPTGCAPGSPVMGSGLATAAGSGAVVGWSVAAAKSGSSEFGGVIGVLMGLVVAVRPCIGSRTGFGPAWRESTHSKLCQQAIHLDVLLD